MQTIDLRRNVLPRAAWLMPWRLGNPTSLTVHYNGPKVENRTQRGEIAQLINDAKWQMRPEWLGWPGHGADGLQYHDGIGAEGQLYLLRDHRLTLAHCGHAVGNAKSISIHLILGGNQDATPAQWTALTQRLDELCGLYTLPRSAVKLHREWTGKTICPGPVISKRLIAWRNGGKVCRVKRKSAVYEGPDYSLSIALGGKATLGVGNTFGGGNEHIDAAGNAWIHRLDGIGFVPLADVDVIG